MAITSQDAWWASDKQQAGMYWQATRTTVANIWFSLFGLAGQPGAGTLAGANTANGVVPTDADAGFPLINAFTGANGYLSHVNFTSTVACRWALFDCVFKAGAYSFNSNVTLASQPSYSSRMPSGTDYTNTEIWLETVTAFTGNQSINITYTNESGTGSRSAGTIATGVAPTVGRLFRVPLQSGDEGVQQINNVTSSVATVGTFNVLVLRRLAQGRVGGNGVNILDVSSFGMPEVFANSALYCMVATDSTSSGNPELNFSIVNE